MKTVKMETNKADVLEVLEKRKSLMFENMIVQIIYIFALQSFAIFSIVDWMADIIFSPVSSIFTKFFAIIVIVGSSLSIVKTIKYISKNFIDYQTFKRKLNKISIKFTVVNHKRNEAIIFRKTLRAVIASMIMIIVLILLMKLVSPLISGLLSIFILFLMLYMADNAICSSLKFKIGRFK